jgi:hypothetical protein
MPTLQEREEKEKETLNDNHTGRKNVGEAVKEGDNRNPMMEFKLKRQAPKDTGTQRHQKL